MEIRYKFIKETNQELINNSRLELKDDGDSYGDVYSIIIEHNPTTFDIYQGFRWYKDWSVFEKNIKMKAREIKLNKIKGLNISIDDLFYVWYTDKKIHILTTSRNG